jgi:hypothetical protein
MCSAEVFILLGLHGGMFESVVGKGFKKGILVKNDVFLERDIDSIGLVN